MRLFASFGAIVALMTSQSAVYAGQASPSATPTAIVSPAVTASPSAIRHPLMKRDWWLALSRAEKDRVVAGAIDGLLNGWWRAFTDYDTKVMVIIIKTDVKMNNGKAWLPAEKELGSASEEVKLSAPTFSKKLGLYIDAVDHFYETYPNTANVTIGEVLQCLSDKPWKSCAEVAKMFSQ